MMLALPRITLFAARKELGRFLCPAKAHYRISHAELQGRGHAVVGAATVRNWDLQQAAIFRYKGDCLCKVYIPSVHITLQG